MSTIREPVTEVGSVRATEGELRFTVSIGGREHEVWLRASEPVVAGADVAAALTLLPAMAVGGTLRIDEPVDELLLRRMGEIQSVFRSWQRTGEWPPAAPFRHELDLACPPAAARPWTADERGVAAFFSGGVDSFATVLANPEITHLIYVSGYDVPLSDGARDAEIRAALGEATERLGKSLITIETNVREIADGRVPWVAYCGSVLGAVARMLAPAIRRVYISASISHRHFHPNGSHPLLDHLWGGEGLEVIHDGAALTRAEKVRSLANSEVARRTLRVCWESPDSEYNCGRCEKCLRTMVTLESLGVRAEFETFPADLDRDAVAATVLETAPTVDYWTEILELEVRRRADPGLIEAVETCLSRVKQTISSPAGRVPPTPAPGVERSRMLHISPRVRLELEGKRGVIFLVGSYAGSGNYGDIAQLQATLELLGPLGDEIALLPVLELGCVATHRELGLPLGADHDPDRWLAFELPSGAAEAAAIDAGLMPATLPGSLAYAATYLYGGGYLNARWARRKLTMVEAVEALAARSGLGEPELFSSGIQIEPGWLRAAGDTQRNLLRRLDRVGVRDPVSLQAAAGLADEHGRPPATLTGDDAVGVIARSPNGSGPDRDGEGLSINLHYCEGEWVTGDPEQLLGFLAGLVGGLAAAAGRPVDVQPVIAYEDGRMSERPQLVRLAAAMRAQGTARSVAEPLLLRPAELAGSSAILGRAHLTVSCSYHVALTSLMLGVPAMLVRHNGYYGQKADGLRRDFDLPTDFFPDPGSEPHAAGERVIEHLRGGEPAAAVARARERLVHRRSTAEHEILARFQEGLDGSKRSGPAADEAVPRDQFEALLRSSELAAKRIGELHELADWQESRLRDMSESSSWRLTGALRRARSLLRGSGQNR